MQKLVTIYLDNMAYEGSTMFKGHAASHGYVEEHLKSELADGWWVVSTSAFGGSGNDPYTVRGWLAVVLEKNSEAV